MIPASGTPLRAPSFKLMEHFRSDRKRQPLHPLERVLVAVVALHLCFLPWALGTMHVWSQLTSLGLGAVGMVLALIPRTYSGDLAPQLSLSAKGQATAGALSSQVSGLRSQASGFFASVSRRMARENRGQTPGWQPHDRLGALSSSNGQPATASFQPSGSSLPVPGSALRLTMWPRLLRFPLFWIGLALLSYLALQGFNPSWVWERNATSWWLRRVNDIPWLPTSIDTPFERFNLWRQFIIYASAWLTVCTLWVGFTRRRSLQILLSLLCVNAVVLAVVGFVHRLLSPSSFFGVFDWPPGASPFASFIYKNHAGSFFALMASLAVALALWTHQEGERRGKKSTPAGLLVLGALLLTAGVLSSHSRGATLTAAGFLALTGFWLMVRSRCQPAWQNRNHTVTAMVTLAFALTLLGSARYLDFSAIADRFSVLNKDPGSTLEARWKVAEAGLAMLDDHGWRGIGAGGFRYLFPEYIKRHPEYYGGGKLFWDHAHRDWLEIPIELGAAGTLLLILGGIYGSLFFLRHAGAWHSLTIPLLLGCAQTLGHAWFDFPFQCPAILLTWLALVAIAARWAELDDVR